MTRKKRGFLDLAGDIVGVVFAVPTFGASMVLSPTARGIVGNVLGGGGSDDSDVDNKLKQWDIQNQQWKTQMEANQKEIESLRKEREKDEKEVKKNDEEIRRLKTIIDDPNRSDEEKERARKRIVLLETENRKLKDKNKERDKQIEEKSKTLPAPSAPLGLSLPKFSAYDKLLVGAILVLIIYFLFLKEDKKR